MAKISVIIPVYNVALYLDQCLRSLAEQTFQDAEYILVNDGSTDGSGGICDQWAENDSRFVVIHKDNGGVSSARNLGLEIASGEYIGFADSDDWLAPEALEHMNGLLDEHPDAQIACAGFYEYLSDPGKCPLRMPDNRNIVLGITDKKTTIRNLLIRQGYWATVWNKLFRRQCIYRNGKPRLFNTALHYGEDENWLLSVMMGVEFCVCSPVPVYYYRSRPSSITHSPRVTPKVLSILDTYNASIEMLGRISPDLQLLSYGRKYNDAFSLQVTAYCSGQMNMLSLIRKEMKGIWFLWLRSPYALPMRKAKVIVVRIMMALRFPKVWVRYAYDIKRKQKEAIIDEV